MKNETYPISHLVLMTGFTDRTIRNYLASGILKGEKIDGVWQFTPEQVDSFIRHPAVRPSLLSKQNSLVYEFLLYNMKSACEACIILDLPGKNGARAAEYFCGGINSGNFQNVQFSFDGAMSVPRVILKGNITEVLGLVNGFSKQCEF